MIQVLGGIILAFIVWRVLLAICHAIDDREPTTRTRDEKVIAPDHSKFWRHAP